MCVCVNVCVCVCATVSIKGIGVDKGLSVAPTEATLCGAGGPAGLGGAGGTRESLRPQGSTPHPAQTPKIAAPRCERIRMGRIDP